MLSITLKLTAEFRAKNVDPILNVFLLKKKYQILKKDLFFLLFRITYSSHNIFACWTMVLKYVLFPHPTLKTTQKSVQTSLLTHQTELIAFHIKNVWRNYIRRKPS